MGTITGLTAERMAEIEGASVVSGAVDDLGHLQLMQNNGSYIDAGLVTGDTGPIGPPGIDGAGHLIATSGNLPVLQPADAGKTVYETDTQLVRTWDGYIWHLQERIICTSTTRPTGLTQTDKGIKIYETDSAHEFVWTGSGWIAAAPPPMGIIASGLAVGTPAVNQMLNLSTVIGGNPSWLAGHVVTLPVGGLYLMQLELQYRSDNVILMGANVRGATGAGYTPEIGIAESHYPSSANVRTSGSWLRQFNANDKFSIRSLGNPPASPGYVQVFRFSVLRIADTLAAS